MLAEAFVYSNGVTSMAPPSPPESSSSSSNSGGDSPVSVSVSVRRLPGRAGLQTLADAASQSTPIIGSGRQRQHKHSQSNNTSQNQSPTAEELSPFAPESPGSPPVSQFSPVTQSLPTSTPTSSFTTRGLTAAATAAGTVASPSSSSSSTSFSGPTTATLGPLSQQISLPPRKQPGRKRATEEPVDKRTAQNRTAQRAYRERRAQVEEEQRKRLVELEAETVPQLQARIAQYEEQRRRDQERIKGLVEELKRERGAGIGNKRRSTPKEEPDHDDKRARHDRSSPSDRSSRTPGVASAAASSPYNPNPGASGYPSGERRRSSLTLPGVAELSLLSGHVGSPQSGVSPSSGKLPPLPEFGQAFGQGSNPHRRDLKGYRPMSGSPERSFTAVSGSPAGESSVLAATANVSRLQRLGLPPPVTGTVSSPLPIYSTTSSFATATITSPAPTNGLVSPPTPSSSSFNEHAVPSPASQPRSPKAMHRLALRNPATDGCGNCEEGGSCPCVDTLVNVEEEEEDGSEESGDVLYTEIK